MSSEQCSICMEDLDDPRCTTLQCTHAFHNDCIAPWLIRNSCPVCRQKIDESKDGERLHIEPEDDDEVANDIHTEELKQMYEERLIDEGDDGDDYQHPPQEQQIFVTCTHCMRDIQLNNVLLCTVCDTSYFCSVNCRERSSHICELNNHVLALIQNMENNNISTPVNTNFP